MNTSKDLPVLYVKSGCPWCREVAAFLRENGIGYREQDVLGDSLAMAELVRKSGRSVAPMLDWHGRILADFGVQELVPFLHAQGVELEDS